MHLSSNSRRKLHQINTLTIIDKMKLLRVVRRRENYRLVVNKVSYSFLVSECRQVVLFRED